jgi:DNA processing protein
MASGWQSVCRAIWLLQAGHLQRTGALSGCCRSSRRDQRQGKDSSVFVTGADVIYPKENTRLTEQIVALGGALISEFPMNTFAAPQNFPIRNRIISGISAGALVIEAAEYSGTRITSRCALEQNREVFAVPGNVTNKNSWGPTP